MPIKNYVNYFHKQPENLNCAQAILKGFQEQFNISDMEIDEYRAWGGGRAEGGVCGALFAAERLLNQVCEKSVSQEFRESAGNILCSDIKKTSVACVECVRIADELVQKSLQ